MAVLVVKQILLQVERAVGTYNKISVLCKLYHASLCEQGVHFWRAEARARRIYQPSKLLRALNYTEDIPMGAVLLAKVHQAPLMRHLLWEVMIDPGNDWRYGLREIVWIGWGSSSRCYLGWFVYSSSVGTTFHELTIMYAEYQNNGISPNVKLVQRSFML